ncbi:hypothetical protein GRS96_12495 [Rathayibacter sp. VKM Ac-2803]|uniref:hypothetical protein n=1 Tax=Rathayibacter sp. VKM Ac-2803 TaxID=2609256 RepID=UPI00135717DD|nr:hypothetical protein [Rathayibacter sp. VKM Ac-2803]MWV50088.1 hypothetical protein [Rathayibacter sp. VKM Ac-2803]
MDRLTDAIAMILGVVLGAIGALLLACVLLFAAYALLALLVHVAYRIATRRRNR